MKHILKMIRLLFLGMNVFFYAEGEGGGGGTPPVPPTPPTPPTPPQPPVDTTAIAKAAIGDFVKSLGYDTPEAMAAAIKAQHKPGGKPTDEDTQKRLEALEKTNGDQLATIRNLRIDNELANLIAASGHTFHSVDDFRAAVKGGVDLDENGDIVIKDSGNIKYNAEGKRLTLKEHFDQFCKSKPYFIKDSVKPGAGIPPSGKPSLSSDAADPELEKLEKELAEAEKNGAKLAVRIAIKNKIVEYKNSKIS